MRLIALLRIRGVPILGFLLLIVFVFDIGGRQPMSDAYITIAERIGQYFGDQIKDAVIPSPTPPTGS